MFCSVPGFLKGPCCIWSGEGLWEVGRGNLPSPLIAYFNIHVIDIFTKYWHLRRRGTLGLRSFITSVSLRCQQFQTSTAKASNETYPILNWAFESRIHGLRSRNFLQTDMAMLPVKPAYPFTQEPKYRWHWNLYGIWNVSLRNNLYYMKVKIASILSTKAWIIGGWSKYR